MITGICQVYKRKNRNKLQQLISKYEGVSEIDYNLAKLWFDCSNLRDLCVPPDGGNMDDQQDEQPLAALQVTKHSNIEQISSLMVPTEPPPKDDAGHAQAAAPRVNFTSITNIPQGILHNPYPKTSYPSSSKTKWQKPEKVIKKPDYIDTFFSEMGYTPKKASSRLPRPSTLSPSVSLHQTMLDRMLTELPNPMIHTGTANIDNDCFYYGQAIKASDREEFRKAMSVEHKAHMKPIKTVWSFKCKRCPDGLPLKHKAHLCAHGSMQEKGINFWETYSPIVRWSIIQLLLTLSITEDLWAWQIDFTLAYPQADQNLP
jgi:Reverse transcriptase (RNA-dependent DNA polymerase)